MKEESKEEKDTEVKKKSKGRLHGKSKQALKEEMALLNDRLLRLQADFENFRKRMIREKNEVYERSNEDIMYELLPVLDHLDIALEAVDKEGGTGAVLEGFKLVAEQMLSALDKFGLIPIDAEGSQFDPNRHEAISHMASDEVAENTVITQVRRGYMLGDKLLRATQVVVSSGDGQEASGGE